MAKKRNYLCVLVSLNLGEVIKVQVDLNLAVQRLASVGAAIDITSIWHSLTAAAAVLQCCSPQGSAVQDKERKKERVEFWETDRPFVLSLARSGIPGRDLRTTAGWPGRSPLYTSSTRYGLHAERNRQDRGSIDWPILGFYFTHAAAAC